MDDLQQACPEQTPSVIEEEVEGLRINAVEESGAVICQAENLFFS